MHTFSILDIARRSGCWARALLWEGADGAPRTRHAGVLPRGQFSAFTRGGGRGRAAMVIVAQAAAWAVPVGSFPLGLSAARLRPLA